MKSNIRVLIADGDKDFRTALSGALQAEEGIEVVAAAGDGVTALEHIRKDDLDLVLIDLMLPELDGLSVLHSVMDEPHHFGVFVISAFASDAVAAECTNLGVSHFLRKPISAEILASRIRQWDLACQSEAPAPREIPSDLDLEVRVTEVIHQVGVPAHIKGYQYLREAIMMAIRDMDSVGAITKSCIRASRRDSIQPPHVWNVPFVMPLKSHGIAAILKHFSHSLVIPFQGSRENQPIQSLFL